MEGYSRYDSPFTLTKKGPGHPCLTLLGSVCCLIYIYVHINMSSFSFTQFQSEIWAFRVKTWCYLKCWNIAHMTRACADSDLSDLWPLTSHPVQQRALTLWLKCLFAGLPHSPLTETGAIVTTSLLQVTRSSIHPSVSSDVSSSDAVYCVSPAGREAECRGRGEVWLSKWHRQRTDYRNVLSEWDLLFVFLYFRSWTSSGGSATRNTPA